MPKFTLPQVAQKPRPVVFLDIDDVLCVHRALNTRQVLAALAGDETVDAAAVWQQIFHPAARENLRLLDEEFGPVYVISSSWTMHLDQQQLRDAFHLAGIGFVADNLHQAWATQRDDEDSYRLVEIEAWLDTHLMSSPFKPSAPFLIIDDVVSGQSLLGSHLENQAVFCDAWTGFNYPKLAVAQGILRSQLK